MTPNVYEYRRSGTRFPLTNPETPYNWRGNTVAKILKNATYLGYTVNCKSRRKSYKDKRKLNVPKEQHLVFKNTQEAIIDLDTWEIVQRVREGKRRPTRMGTMDKFSGLVFCADCGNRHYCIRATTMTKEQTNYICGTCRKKGKEVCTAHFIRAIV